MHAGEPEISHDGGALIVAPVGDVDLSNAARLRTAVLHALANDREDVIVDLSRTGYVDSSGIRALFSIARRLQERRRRLAVVAAPGAHVRRLLTIVDIESCATVHESLDDARAAFARP